MVIVTVVLKVFDISKYAESKNLCKANYHDTLTALWSYPTSELAVHNICKMNGTIT